MFPTVREDLDLRSIADGRSKKWEYDEDEWMEAEK